MCVAVTEGKEEKDEKDSPEDSFTVPSNITGQ